MRRLFTTVGPRDFSAFWCKVLILCGIVIVSFTKTGISQTWSEDWEGNWFQNWFVDSGTWEVGIPTSGPGNAYNGLKCAATVLNGNYSEPVDSRLIRFTSFTVPPATDNPRLRFWHWYNFSAADNGEVQISTDGGTTWETISTIYTNTSSSVWTYTFIDLSAYAGSTAQIAFDFHSHNSGGGFNDVSSGWYIDDVAVITGPIVFNNPEGFELGIGDWFADRGTWEVGVPTSGPGSANTGQNCAATRLIGNYDENVDSRLISPPFSVPPPSENPRLRFWHWYSFSAADKGEVHIKVENGNWQTIFSNYTSTGSNTWSSPFIDLSAYGDSTVQIAFYFQSRNSGGGFIDVSSGWYIDDVAVITGPIVFNNPEGFELGIGDWFADRGTWEVGVPTSGPDSAYNGQNCAATRLIGNYDENVDSRLVSPPFLVPSNNPGLQFWHWYSFSAADNGEVQISTDGGTTWETISPQFINTSSGVWTTFFISLSAYAGSTAQIAFDFHSRNSGGGFIDVSSGWYIDEINILPDIIPVELTSFTAILANEDVQLEWSTATETNNQGFEIQRRNENSEYQKIGYVPGHGTTTQEQNYSYIDSKVVSGNYFYRLKQIDFDGSFEYSSEVAVNVTVPLEFALEQNYPNPFNPSTNIQYAISSKQFVTLKVYDVLGNEVATLVNEEKPAGSYEVNFSAKGGATNLSSGIYFYRLQANDFTQIKKMILLK